MSSFVVEYLAALQAADVDRVLALFTEGAVVHSPLYGTLTARTFYPALFEDTAESRLTLNTVLEGTRDNVRIVAFWFEFDWILADGTPAPFSAVDIAELSNDGLINTLHIIYDSATVRPLFDRSRHRIAQD